MQTTTGNTFDHNCLTFDEYDDFHLVIGDQTAPEIFWSWSVQHWARSTYHKIDPQPLISQAFMTWASFVKNTVISMLLSHSA